MRSFSVSYAIFRWRGSLFARLVVFTLFNCLLLFSSVQANKAYYFCSFPQRERERKGKRIFPWPGTPGNNSLSWKPFHRERGPLTHCVLCVVWTLTSPGLGESDQLFVCFLRIYSARLSQNPACLTRVVEVYGDPGMSGIRAHSTRGIKSKKCIASRGVWHGSVVIHIHIFACGIVASFAERVLSRPPSASK